MQRPVLRTETPPRRQELDNGCVLLTRPLPEVYGIAVGVIVRTGTSDEPEGVGGISHLLEHMVFKGTPTRTAFDLASQMEALGGQLDAYTTKEHTAYTIKILPAQLAEGLDILSDMLERSTFEESALELEKQVVVEEILSSEDTPDDYAHERFAEKLWPAHPLRNPILGTEESVRGIDRSTLAAWADRVHRGSNVIVAASGAITAHEEDLIGRAFGFPAGKPVDRALETAPPSPGVHCFHAKSLLQQYVELGIPALHLRHEDRFALSVLSNLLGGGMSSRLFQRVREEQGLAYSIYNYVDFNRDSGILATSYSSSQDNCQRALDIVAEEYRRMRAGDLSNEEIDSNKAQLVSSVVLGMESTVSQMLRLARGEMAFGRFVDMAEIIERVEGVTRDDLVRLAVEFLDPDLQTVVGYGPAKTLGWPSAAN